jgi:hypothetical protein
MASQLQEDETLEGVALENVLAGVQTMLGVFDSDGSPADGAPNGASAKSANGTKSGNGAKKAHTASRPRARA